MQRQKPKNKLLVLSNALLVAAITVLLAGIIISYNQWRASQGLGLLSATANHPQNIDGEGAPSTEKPAQDEFDSHQVAADMPRYIFIPKLSVKAIVKPVGVTAEGNMDVPDNVHIVGWYDKGAKPGKPGATVVDGHSVSGTSPGVFYDLESLQPGDEIQIERGDGEIITYKVAESRTYNINNVDMKAAITPISPGKPGLNLITCTGNIIPGTHDYDQRHVVFAEQV